jgi:RNA methyltransferase, TrmH family
MATPLGSHAERLTLVRALRTAKGRKEQRRYAFEGATLLAEAYRAAVPIEELYVTRTAYESTPLVRELEAGGVQCFLVAERVAGGISDVESASGLLAVTSIRPVKAADVFSLPGTMPLLADLNDPANAGGLLRSADAFGCRGALFGDLGIDPYHPKVVRGSMGAVFRLRLAISDPDEAAAALRSQGRVLLGLAAGGEDIAAERWETDPVLAVGHERRGLGRWEELCSRLLSIPMPGRAESLSAAVAGSIGLYLASRRSLHATSS